MTLLRRGKISISILFVLSLFLIGVMMCSVTLLFSPTGHNFFVKGCDQVSLMMSYITFDRSLGVSLTLMTLFVMTMFGKDLQLNSLMNGKEQTSWSKKKLFLVRAVVDPVLLSFKQGIIRNLSYN